MSVSYTAVQWNKHKKRYDLTMVAIMAMYLLAFFAISLAMHQPPHEISIMQLLIRAFGSMAIIMLHIILVIGPLCRLSPKFYPLLYNRRHLGVTMFLMALIHSLLATLWYHAGSSVNPIISIFTANTNYDSLIYFPFQTLGFIALMILFLMAATSHDFWLKNLSPRTWKSLHMLVYLAYGLLIMHVALGVLQTEKHPAYVIITVIGPVTVIALHLAAGWVQLQRDAKTKTIEEGWVHVGDADDIRDGRAKLVHLKNSEPIAVFRHGNQLTALTNVCAHQGGPLGEGKIVDGCVTCPWHGYQYRPEDGQSPPPYAEKVTTYQLRLDGRALYVNAQALPAGTPTPPVILEMIDG